MKSRVEASNLREIGKARSDRFDTGDLVRQVQRSKRNQTSQLADKSVG